MMSFNASSAKRASLSKCHVTPPLPLLAELSLSSGKCYINMVEIYSWIVKERKGQL